ncbi:hypothetical protein DTO166G4_1718 [Paecilomyces variotii]|nr:hypothetical protein DTO166G4_1718 [Paecilomyces variotii]KAJ9223340.1 hypothetical protein DTO169C6_4386 [Paecilomyces variotii]KAJ9227674.1 hypothetical protein DTO166G5_9270 [Paecilomyces variotii]KAJ9254022.1 hypothetical protein DTO207G8_3883 [Paecilomyces variotii]KAJ9264482.1 hypothetical protein DTO195F2_2299 [Paecilomyces variotii]
MRSSVVLMVSAFAAGIAAQANYTLPAGFNPGEVSSTEKASWCTGQRNLCPKICGGAANVNTCDPDSLSFSCVCSDGSVPDSAEYTQSLPYFVCEANFGQCIQNHPNDLDGQNQCKEQAKCGTKNATSDAASTSSAAATSGTAVATTLTTATTTAGGQVATTTAAKATASTSHSAASAVKVAQDYSAALLVGGLLAGFQFVL